MCEGKRGLAGSHTKEWSSLASRRAGANTRLVHLPLLVADEIARDEIYSGHVLNRALRHEQARGKKWIQKESQTPPYKSAQMLIPQYAKKIVQSLINGIHRRPDTRGLQHALAGASGICCSLAQDSRPNGAR